MNKIIRYSLLLGLLVILSFAFIKFEERTISSFVNPKYYSEIIHENNLKIHILESRYKDRSVIVFYEKDGIVYKISDFKFMFHPNYEIEIYGNNIITYKENNNYFFAYNINSNIKVSNANFNESNSNEVTHNEIIAFINNSKLSKNFTDLQNLLKPIEMKLYHKIMQHSKSI